MATEPDSLVLEHLRAIRSDIADARRRIGNIEQELVSQGRLLAILVEGQASGRARFAELEQRLDRIDKRLGLIDA
ncbi:MAG: hypothetical protein AB7O57_14845 [Hyphomicrobiaceae bacterium]